MAQYWPSANFWVPPGQAASHLVFLSKQIRTRFLSTNQFNHPPPASTGPAKKASKVVHICFSLDLLGEKDVTPCLSSGLMSSFSHQCDCRFSQSARSVFVVYRYQYHRKERCHGSACFEISLQELAHQTKCVPGQPTPATAREVLQLDF